MHIAAHTNPEKIEKRRREDPNLHVWQVKSAGTETKSVPAILFVEKRASVQFSNTDLCLINDGVIGSPDRKENRRGLMLLCGKNSTAGYADL